MFSRFKGPNAIITQKHRIYNSPTVEISIFKKNTGSHSTVDMRLALAKIQKICLSGSFFIFALEAFPWQYSGQAVNVDIKRD